MLPSDKYAFGLLAIALVIWGYSKLPNATPTPEPDVNVCDELVDNDQFKDIDAIACVKFSTIDSPSRKAIGECFATMQSRLNSPVGGAVTLDQLNEKFKADLGDFIRRPETAEAINTVESLLKDQGITTRHDLADWYGEAAEGINHAN